VTNKTDHPVPYGKRLARESARFGLRVGGMLCGVVGGAIWEAAKQLPTAAVSTSEHSESATPIGSYWEAQEAFESGRIEAAEMAYYRAVYNSEDG
jgi:hypothetical protein